MLKFKMCLFTVSPRLVAQMSSMYLILFEDVEKVAHLTVSIIVYILFYQ